MRTTSCRVSGGLVLLLTILLALAPAMFAQTGATITGTVADATGAIIPAATVTLTNEASGDTRRSQSNAEGFFSFVAVPPGAYSVRVEVQGFTKWETTGVTVNPGDRRNIAGIVLKPGGTSESVEVVAASETITPVDSGEKAAVITTKELQNVSIVGRNAAEFIKILPGMAMNAGAENRASFSGETAGTGQGPIGSFSAQGQRNGALDITADGAHIIDPGCNCGQSVNTNADMMQEIKVLTSNFGAENAKGPVVISAIGKSGGRDYHGEAYFYARHSSMFANDWLNNSAGVRADNGKMVSPRPETSYWYPGGQIGGPVLIPGTNFNKDRDKMFFHFAAELYDQVIDNGIYRTVVPTAEMRQGLFSQDYLNGYRGSSYIGYSIQNAPRAEYLGADGKIRPELISPIGQKLMNMYPLPNVDPKVMGGANYMSNYTREQNMIQIRPRVDYSFSDNLKLYVTYNRQRDWGNAPNGLDTLWWRPENSVPYPTPLVMANNTHSLTTNLTKVFSPTLTNEFLFTFTSLNLPNRFENPEAVNRVDLGIDYETIWDHPKEARYIPALTSWGSTGVSNMIQTGGFEYGSRYAKKLTPSIADNVAKVWGTHTLKTGFYWENITNEQPGEGYLNGQLQFADWVGGSSGNAYADMLMGGPFTYTEANINPLLRMHYWVAEGYVQDSWKATRRLTLDGGVRFSHMTPWQDQDNFGFAVWNPALYNNDPSARKDFTGFTWYARDKNVPKSGVPSRALFINPRVGFAFDIFGTGSTVLRGGFGVYRWHDEQNVVNASFNITRGAYAYTPGTSQTFETIGQINPEEVIPSNPQGLRFDDDQQPRTMSYSFTISQRLPWKSLFEIAYVGNKSDYLSNYNNSFNKPNFLPIGTFLKPDIWSLDVNQDLYRPYRNYGADLKIITHEMYSNYNSLQVSWNKQSGNFTWMANYTFSKSLGVRGEGGATVGDPTNYRNSYGVLPNDRTHIFNIAYVIEVPKITSGNAFLKGLVNGWQISGITQFQSGVNLQASYNANLNFSGYFPNGTVLPNGEVVGPDNPNPDYQSVGLNNERLLGTPDVSLMPKLICDPRKNLKEGQYVNGACFAPPTFGQNGNFIWPYLRGPNFFNNDLSLFKNFDVAEGKRLQFRVSAFNFLNHPLRSFVSGDQNLVLAFDQAGQLTTQRFGFADRKTGHRLMQLAVKYSF